MLDVKENLRGKYNNDMCRGCGLEKETQGHVLNECYALHPTNKNKVEQNTLLTNNIDQLRQIATNINITMHKLTKGEVTQPPPQVEDESHPGDPGIAPI